MNRKIIAISVSISIILWLITSAFFLFSKQEILAKNLEATLQKDVIKKENQIQALLQNDSLMAHIWENKLSESELSYLSEQSFIIHMYDTASLAFWSKNDFPVSEKRFIPRIKALTENGNVFLYQSVGNAAYSTKRINFIIPIFIHYEVENEYLKSYFFASKLIPSSSLIFLEKKEETSSPILSNNGGELFHISINEAAIKPLEPSQALLFIIVCTILFTTISIYVIGLYIAHRKGNLAAIGFLGFFIAVRLFVIYYWGMPFAMSNLDIFSPMLFGSSRFLPSLGHLLIHVYILFWLFLWINNLPYKPEQITLKKHNNLLRLILMAITFAVVGFLACYFQNLISSLVFNSNISFDTNTFKAINKYTIFALIVISLLGIIFLLILKKAYSLISRLSHKPFQAYIIAGSVFTAIILLKQVWNYFNYQQAFSYNIALLNIGAIGIIILQVYIFNTAFAKKVFNQNALFGHIYLSIMVALLLASFFKINIDVKERTVYRSAFAEQLSKKQNTEFELSFDNVLQKINKDNTIKEWLQNKELITAKQLERHFISISPHIFNVEYNQKVSLFTTDNKSLVANDFLTTEEAERIKANSGPTLNSFLFFNPDSANNANYIAYIPIFNTKEDTLLGNIFINIRPKTFITQAVYPKILQNSQDLLEKKASPQYDFAFYQFGKLKSQKGDYNFPATIELPQSKKTFFENKDGYSLAHYAISSIAQYIVIYKNNFWVGLLRIFSLLFILSLILLSLQERLSKFTHSIFNKDQLPDINSSSLSVRIKYFVLGFAAISFFLIGAFTIIFIKNRYQAESISNIENRITNTTDAIVEHIQSLELKDEDSSLDEHQLQCATSDFLLGLAKQQKIDINYFDNNGKLISTTQDLIYNDNILSKDMNPKAFFAIQNDMQKSYVKPEYIGKLQYTAAYRIAKTNNGTQLGIINVPSFYANENLDSEILQLLTTFIIIYSLLIILSSVIIFTFVNRVSNSLSVVTEGLKAVNLNKNEPIHWPYNDEIGQLVHEFNKMVVTVEQSTRARIVDERQSAWREMAQQVAHEIKNPLTPMKLNLQYLQQAINNNQPNINDLTRRVSNSIIEQIDNLNYIASEFSNFAKMPENNSEKIDLKALIERSLILFSGNENVTVTHQFPEEQIYVFVDHSQMLRIVNNIIQNAIEAMPPPPHQGLVQLSLQYSADKQSIIIIVQDNGEGVPEDLQASIFEPYFTTKSSGTGLGLAMSCKMVEIWGGHLSLAQSSSAGTTFHISIPIC